MINVNPENLIINICSKFCYMTGFIFETHLAVCDNGTEDLSPHIDGLIEIDRKTINEVFLIKPSVHRFRPSIFRFWSKISFISDYQDVRWTELETSLNIDHIRYSIKRDYRVLARLQRPQSNYIWCRRGDKKWTYRRELSLGYRQYHRN